ncbi:MAG: enoyl-CoA hydratase-related protein [Spongiibacteraceae bacterium]
MSEQSLFLDIDNEGIATLTMNRVQQFNAISVELMQRMLGYLTEIEFNPNVRAVILRGNGPAFSGGGDLATMREHIDQLPRFLGEIIDAFHTSLLAMRRLKVPTIAQVHGSAAGAGVSLAMACDFVVAAENTRFVVAYPKLATSTDGGLTYYLTQRVGTARALDILLLRDQLSAREALDLGLISRVAAPENLEAEARAVALRIAQLPAQSVSELKGLVLGFADSALANQLAAERAAFVRNAGTKEFADRIVAFLDKKR